MTDIEKEADMRMLALDARILGYAGCHAISTRLRRMCDRKHGHDGRHGWMGRDGWETWTRCVKPEDL